MMKTNLEQTCIISSLHAVGLGTPDHHDPQPKANHETALVRNTRKTLRHWPLDSKESETWNALQLRACQNGKTNH
jgi:hypothetical protein